MQLYLMRHGQDLNPDQDRLTDADPLLSELGKKQATDCAVKIKDAIDSSVAPIIIASPRMRTMQTATLLATQLGNDPASIRPDVRLKERDCAAYSGQLVTEVFSRPEEDLIAGGMEPYSNLQERLGSFYDDVLRDIDEPTIIVTHSGNIEPLMKLAHIDNLYTLDADSFIRLL